MHFISKIKTHAPFEAHRENLNKIDPQYQRRIYSLVTTCSFWHCKAYADIRGVPWIGGVKR